jgi:hypothetical protein
VTWQSEERVRPGDQIHDPDGNLIGFAETEPDEDGWFRMLVAGS